MTRGRLLASSLVLLLVTLVVIAFLPQPIEVQASRVERGTLQVAVEEDGRTRLRERYSITAPVAGRALRIRLDVGQTVSEGQVLVELRPLPLSPREREEQLARAQAAAAVVSEAEESVKRAASEHGQARRERQRVEELVSRRFMSEQAAEQARVLETTTRLALDAARHHVKVAEAELEVAKAALISLEDSVEPPPAVLLRSPVDGRVLQVPEKSERVVSAGTELLTVGDPAALEVVIDVLSQDAVRIEPGALVLLDGWGGTTTLEARVRTVEPHAFTKVSALGVEEQRVNVVADFLEQPRRLGDGFRVEARIVTYSAADVLKVPVDALFRQAGNWAVFVVEEGRARSRTVEPGERSAFEAEVRGGLAGGELVLRYPSNEIADGARVQLR